MENLDILDSGGYNKLQEYFQTTPICKTMKPADEMPSKGLYREVEEKWKPVSMPALIFGYIWREEFTL